MTLNNTSDFVKVSPAEQGASQPAGSGAIQPSMTTSPPPCRPDFLDSAGMYPEENRQALSGSGNGDHQSYSVGGFTAASAGSEPWTLGHRVRALFH